MPGEKGSRIGLLNKYGSFGTGFPQWSEVSNNETYWNLVNEMGIIAKKQGKRTIKHLPVSLLHISY